MKVKILENKTIKILNYKVKFLQFAVRKTNSDLIEIRLIKKHLNEDMDKFDCEEYMFLNKRDIKKLNDMFEVVN